MNARQLASRLDYITDLEWREAGYRSPEQAVRVLLGDPGMGQQAVYDRAVQLVLERLGYELDAQPTTLRQALNERAGRAEHPPDCPHCADLVSRAIVRQIQQAGGVKSWLDQHIRDAARD